MFRSSEGARLTRLPRTIILYGVRGQPRVRSPQDGAGGREHSGHECVVRSLGSILRAEWGDGQICPCYNRAVTKHFKLVV